MAARLQQNGMNGRWEKEVAFVCVGLSYQDDGPRERVRQNVEGVKDRINGKNDGVLGS
jgi:hypothetical protein